MSSNSTIVILTGWVLKKRCGIKKPELTLAKTAKVLSVSCFIIAVNQHLLRKCALKSECPPSDGWEP